MRMHQKYPLGLIASLTKLEESEIEQKLISQIGAYTERNLTHRFMHFWVYEHLIKASAIMASPIVSTVRETIRDLVRIVILI